MQGRVSRSPQNNLLVPNGVQNAVLCVKKCFRADVGFEFGLIEIASMVASWHSVAWLTEIDPREKETR
jgi:hypothetical protein